MDTEGGRFGECAGPGGGVDINGDSPEREASGGESWRWQPAYAKLESEGKLDGRVRQAYNSLKRCELCPRKCGVDRLAGRTGFCKTAARAIIYSYSAHFGEEGPLAGRHGSGTIFISNCNLRCVFCQNWPIAHEGRGSEISDERLAQIMLELQERGCHNINFVTPTHVIPNILKAVQIACRKGLRVPLCYNTGGFDRAETIRLLDGVFDIYLPDMKFMDGSEAARYTARGAENYPEMARKAITEMYRQVGDLVTDARGIALQGLMIRHMVMPDRAAETRAFVKWVARNLSKNTYVNIMGQYRVEHKAGEFKRIARPITPREFLEAIDWAAEAGLTNIDERSLSLAERYRGQG